MIGTNILQLNLATMQQAVADYLNAQLVGTKVKVTNISALASASDGFRVYVVTEVPDGGEAK